MSTPVAGALATVPLQITPSNDALCWWNDAGATWETATPWTYGGAAGPYVVKAGDTMTGPLTQSGSNAAYWFNDRTGTSPAQWAWYATGGSAFLFNNVNSNVVGISGGGSINASGNINIGVNCVYGFNGHADPTANRIGASDDTNLNFQLGSGNGAFRFFNHAGGTLLSVPASGAATLASSLALAGATVANARITLDLTYTNTPPVINKIDLYNNQYGFGISGGSFDLVSGGGFTFWSGTTNVHSISSNGTLSTAGPAFFNGADGNSNCVIVQGGALWCTGSAFKPGGGSWSAPSARPLKQDIKPYLGGLTELLTLQPVSYRYREISGYDPEPTYIGLVYEETGSMPELHRVEQKDDGSEIPALDHSPLIFALINSVKTLSERIDALVAGLPPGLQPPDAARATS